MIVVIGAGPAGLCASLAAAQSGSKVLLIDNADTLGGQFWKHASTNQLDLEGQSLLQRVSHNPNIDILLKTQVWRIVRESEQTILHVLVAGKSSVVKADTLILATGAYDRTLPFPGWDIPGVLTPGAAQTLLKTSCTLAGKKILIAGSGPFLLPVTKGLVEAGAEIVGVFEANQISYWFRYFYVVIANPSKILQAVRYFVYLKSKGIRVERKLAVTSAHASADGKLASVTVAKVRRDFQIIGGSHRTLSCDALAIGWGFTADLSLASNLDLAQYCGPDGGLFVKVDSRQETSIKGVFAAGELTGVGGSDLACVEGEIAGLAASGSRRIPIRLKILKSLRTQFARTLMKTYSVGNKWTSWLTEETVVCRCEEVRLSDIRNAIHELNATDVRSTKLLCRVGMGMCQGRICGRSTIDIFRKESGTHPTIDEQVAFAKRPIVSPINLGAIAKSSDIEYVKEKD